jgi:hypothetical protein
MPPLSLIITSEPTPFMSTAASYEPVPCVITKSPDGDVIFINIIGSPDASLLITLNVIIPDSLIFNELGLTETLQELIAALDILAENANRRIKSENNIKTMKTFLGIYIVYT